MADDKEIRSALIAHKAEIENAHSEAFAVQAILNGLLRQLDVSIVKGAFDYAADVAIAASDRTGSPQMTRSLQITDQLRGAVLRD